MLFIKGIPGPVRLGIFFYDFHDTKFGLLMQDKIYLCGMGVWKQISEYLYLKKKDPNRPKSKWIGYMHGINRISLLIFILCLIILAIKLLT